MSDREQQIKEKREEFLRLAEANADRALNDQRWNALRTPTNRKLLVVATFVVLLVYGVANYVDMPLVVLPALITFFLLLLAMRTASRTIPDLPEELADERMRAVRGRVYRLAYLTVVALYSLVFVTEILLRVVAKAGLPVTPLDVGQLVDLLFVAFFAALAIPSAIFLWIEPEL